MNPVCYYENGQWQLIAEGNTSLQLFVENNIESIGILMQYIYRQWFILCKLHY